MVVKIITLVKYELLSIYKNYIGTFLIFICTKIRQSKSIIDKAVIFSQVFFDNPPEGWQPCLKLMNSLIVFCLLLPLQFKVNLKYSRV